MSFALASSRRALLPAARQLQKAANLTPSRRGVATVSHVDESIARVTMCAPPVNTMNLAFIEELTATIQQIEADKVCMLQSACAAKNPRVGPGPPHELWMMVSVEQPCMVAKTV